MDVASAKWLSEMGIEEYNIFKDLNQLSFMIADDHDHDHHNMNMKQSLSSESNSSHSTITKSPSFTKSRGTSLVKHESTREMVKKPKREVDVMHFSAHHLLTKELSFNNNGGDHHLRFESSDHKGNNKRTHSSMTRSPSHAHDHIIAERKRREKLSQRFIALSAILPCLTKMDKASVLGDAIKYVKELQERVAGLEEQTKKRTVESVVFVKKSQLELSGDDDTSSSNEIPDANEEIVLPEIEAKVSEKDVLIRVHCQKQKGFAAKILSEVETLHLSVLNISVLPFGNKTLDITIVAQMEEEFSMSVKDLVKNLRLALLKFM